MTASTAPVPVQTDNEQLTTSGEDVASTVDGVTSSSSVTGAAAVAPPTSLLSDAKRYRKRAQAAERTVEQLQADLADRDRTIHEHQQTIAQFERRTSIDQALRDAKTLDIEAARALTEAALARMTQPDIAAAVADLRRSKPYLFQQVGACVRAGSGVMSARSPDADAPAAALNRAASEALETGRRMDLLRYLRLRRKP